VVPSEARRLLIRLGYQGVKVGEALEMELEKICAIEPELWRAAVPGAKAVIAEIKERLVSWRSCIGLDSQASTAQDFRRDRRTEIDYISGSIARKEEEARVPAPMQVELTDLVKRLEREGGGKCLE